MLTNRSATTCTAVIIWCVTNCTITMLKIIVTLPNTCKQRVYLYKHILSSSIDPKVYNALIFIVFVLFQSGVLSCHSSYFLFPTFRRSDYYLILLTLECLCPIYITLIYTCPVYIVVYAHLCYKVSGALVNKTVQAPVTECSETSVFTILFLNIHVAWRIFI